MAFGIGAPGRSPEAHPGEIRFRTLKEYRDIIREIVRQELVDIMLMSASTSEVLTIGERHLRQQPGHAGRARANDTTDIHVVRGGKYLASPPLDVSLGDARPHPVRQDRMRPAGARHSAPISGSTASPSTTDSTTTSRRSKRSRSFGSKPSGRASGTSWKSSIRTVATRFDAKDAGSVHQRHRSHAVWRASPAPAGRCSSRSSTTARRPWKSCTATIRSLVIGILGGSAGTTYDAFKLLAEAKKYGAKRRPLRPQDQQRREPVRVHSLFCA